MASISVDISAMVKALDMTKAELQRRVEKTLVECGKSLLAWSLDVVPVDTGVLRDSGTYWQQGKGFNTIVYVSYNTPYALIVHEDLTLRHGIIYNIYYATQIAAGITHERKEQEQAQYLLEPLLVHMSNGDFLTVMVLCLIS